MSAATWTPMRVTIAGPDGEPAELNGWQSAKHALLAITECAGRFGITHLESGRSIAKYFVTSSAAAALIDAIADLADWSQDAPALRADEALIARLWRIRADIYRREEDGDFGPVDHDLIAELNRFDMRLEELQPTHELGQKARLRGRRRG